MTRAACTADHAALKRDHAAWGALRHVGRQYLAADASGPEVALELRDCACGSTLCVEVEATDADRAAA